jgi:cell division protein FtsQ
MVRSFAGRSFAASPARAGTGRQVRPAKPRRWRALSTLITAAGGCLELLRRRRRLRIALLGVLGALPLLAGGWLWLRHSSLVSVERVRVSGVHGPDAGAIEAALAGAGRHMTTLDVRPEALRAAVAPFRVVRDVQASPSFPHGLHIRVIEQLPVAALTVGATRTAVAADGVVLGPALLSGSLPALSGTAGSVTRQHLKSPDLLAAVTVLGAAPAPLARAATRVFTGPKGLTVAMRNGLLAYFGDATRPRAKWLALARVLSDPGAAYASYVDLRLPERPAAGFAPGTAPPATSASGTTASGSEQASSSEATAASLAAGLTAAAGGASSRGEAASPASTPTETRSTTPVEKTPPTPAEAPGGSSAPGG